VRKFIQQCPTCQKNRVSGFQGTTTKFSLSVYSDPMSRLSIDTVGPFPADLEGNKYILVIIDNFSRYITLWPRPDATAETAAKAIIQHIAHYGTPIEIQTDGGPEFYGALVRELISITGIEQFKNAPYSHEENGIVERSIQTLQKHLRAMIFDFEFPTRWSEFVPLVQRIMNSSFHSAIGCAPASLIFGCAIDLDAGVLYPHQNPSGDNVSDRYKLLIDYQEMIIKKVQNTLRAVAKEDPTDGRDVRDDDYPSGSYVIMRYPEGRKPNKLVTPMRGPYRVIELVNDHVTVEDLMAQDEGHKRFTVHTSQVRPFNFDPDRVKPQAAARRDTGNQIISKVNYMEDRGKKMRKNDLYFSVSWEGYGDEYDTFEPWKSLIHTAQLHLFLHENNMDKLIPKEDRRADNNYAIQLTDQEVADGWEA
jgi:Integrase core domain